jgi:hypothetical protein
VVRKGVRKRGMRCEWPLGRVSLTAWNLHGGDNTDWRLGEINTRNR